MSYDTEIERLTKQIEEMREPLRQQCDNWLDAVAKAGADHWDQAAREVVTVDEPERTKELSPEDLADLRGEVNSMVANARELARRHFMEGHQSLWPHLRDDMTILVDNPDSSMGPKRMFHVYSTGYHSNRAPTVLDEPVSQFFALVATPLREHGFQPKDYRLRGEVADGMAAEMAGFSELFDQLVDAQEALAKVREEKEQSEAGDLWDQA